MALFDASALAGKVAVVTGGGSGIGQGSAVALGAAGAAVVVADVDASRGQETADRIVGAGGRAIAVTCDVRVRAEVDALVDRAVGEFGRLDVMCNNAGGPFQAMIADVDDALLDAGLALNFKSVLYGCQAALRPMTAQGSGSIINTSSTGIDMAAPGIGVYAITKAAIAMLTRTLATEVGPLGIRVNALAPGLTDTNFFRDKRRPAQPGEPFTATWDGLVDTVSQMTPLGRIGQPEDQAGLVVFLASDASSFVTGQILRSNGGTTMPW
jgi:3-oxoacyl-[acyl-carrier protein] reductase